MDVTEVYQHKASASGHCSKKEQCFTTNVHIHLSKGLTTAPQGEGELGSISQRMVRVARK